MLLPSYTVTVLCVGVYEYRSNLANCIADWKLLFSHQKNIGHHQNIVVVVVVHHLIIFDFNDSKTIIKNQITIVSDLNVNLIE